MNLFDTRNTLPEGFLDTPTERVHELLPRPTLIHLPGERPDVLFVSVLQHGNEDTGLHAVQQLLAQWPQRPLPRRLSLFIGNVEAARHRRRRLDHQPDYNRCWPGTEIEECHETRMLAAVVDAMRDEPLFASVDVHNTSGANPHYAGVNMLDDTCLQLALRFGRTVVYFTRPRGLQAQAFQGLCPSVILECGRVGNTFGVEHTRAYLEELLRLEALPTGAPSPADIDLLRSIGLVIVPERVRFRFSDDNAEGADLLLDPEIDRFNFQDLPAGTRFGSVRGTDRPLCVLGPDGEEITREFFTITDGELRLCRPAMPSLLTRDPRIIRQDCLCHLMERLPPPGARAKRAA